MQHGNNIFLSKLESVNVSEGITKQMGERNRKDVLLSLENKQVNLSSTVPRISIGMSGCYLFHKNQTRMLKILK